MFNGSEAEKILMLGRRRNVPNRVSRNDLGLSEAQVLGVCVPTLRCGSPPRAVPSHALRFFLTIMITVPNRESLFVLGVSLDITSLDRELRRLTSPAML